MLRVSKFQQQKCYGRRWEVLDIKVLLVCVTERNKWDLRVGILYFFPVRKGLNE